MDYCTKIRSFFSLQSYLRIKQNYKKIGKSKLPNQYFGRIYGKIQGKHQQFWNNMILLNCKWLSVRFMCFPSTDKRFLQGYYFEEIPRSASGLNTANTKTDEWVLAHLIKFIAKRWLPSTMKDM